MVSVTNSSSQRRDQKNRSSNLQRRNRAFMAQTGILAALVLMFTLAHSITHAPAGSKAHTADDFCSGPPPWPGAALLCFRQMDINSASMEELDLLPGVGTKSASQLIGFRMERGFLLDADELSDISYRASGRRLQYIRRYIATDD